MNSASLGFLHTLLTIPSPSGFERRIGRCWRSYLEDVVDRVDVDVMGNNVVEVHGTGGPRIMLTAHLDEIGLMVTRVGDDGLARFRPIGGVHVETLPGQSVVILTDGGEGDVTVPGVIGWNAYARESNGPPKLDGLFIDLGVDTGPEAKRLVRPGDPAVIDASPHFLNEERLVARGLDNKIGAFIIAEVLQRYARDRGAATLVGAATTMEEIGCYGAITVAYDRSIDACLWVDTTYDTLLPGIDPDVYGAHGVGKGPVFCVGGMISPQLQAGLRETAEALELSIQYEVTPVKTLTDADYIQLSQRGIAHAGLFIATRSVHTACETLSLRDVEQTIDLLTAYLRHLPADLDLRRM